MEGPASEIDHNTTRMIMQFRFFVRTVVDINYHHMVIFKMQFVMLGFHLGWVLCSGNVHHQTQRQGCADKSAQHGASLLIGMIIPYGRLNERYSRRREPVNAFEDRAAPKWLLWAARSETSAIGLRQKPSKFLLVRLFFFRSLVLTLVLDGKQLHFKNERGVRANLRGRAALSIGQISRNKKLPLGTDRHELKRFGPSLDDSSYREGRRLAPLIGTIELCPIDQRAAIVANH